MAQVTVCFDLDGVLCSQTAGDYENAVPNEQAIALVNDLVDRGVRVIIHTSRFMGRAGDRPEEARAQGLEFTERQLTQWGVRYSELFMGKPRYDLVIDDRSLFFDADWTRIGAEVRRAISARLGGR